MLNGLGFNHVKYDLKNDGNEYISRCPCMCDREKELIFAEDKEGTN